MASVSGHISVVGGAGTVLHSTDGTSWTTQRVGKRVFQAVASSGTTFLSTSGGSDVWLSTDGLKWTPQKVTLPGLTSLGNVIWDGSRWVGFSDNFDSPQALLASNDGATWTKLMDLPPFDRNIAVRTINAIAYTGSRYVVAGSRSDTDSPYVATTSDGTDWQQVSLGDFSSTSRRIPW